MNKNFKRGDKIRHIKSGKIFTFYSYFHSYNSGVINIEGIQQAGAEYQYELYNYRREKLEKIKSKIRCIK